MAVRKADHGRGLVDLDTAPARSGVAGGRVALPPGPRGVLRIREESEVMFHAIAEAPGSQGAREVGAVAWPREAVAARESAVWVDLGRGHQRAGSAVLKAVQNIDRALRK